MKALKERILRDGKCFEGGILKVDNFINHQMDPILMKSMAVEFVRRRTPCGFCQEEETKHHGEYAYHYGLFIHQRQKL